MDENYELMKCHESCHDSGMDANFIRKWQFLQKPRECNGTVMKTVILGTIKITRQAWNIIYNSSGKNYNHYIIRIT